MSDATNPATVPQSQVPSTEPLAQALTAVAWWASTSPALQALVLTDADKCVAGGLDLAEYLAGLADYTDAASYLADAGIEVPAPATATPATAELSDADKAAAQQDASRKLAAVVKEYTRGERGLTKHRLEAGRLADEYIRHRVLVLRHDRSAAVKSIAGRLAKVSGQDVDVNALVATYHATGLLGADVETAKVPYTALETYVVLVQRDQSTEGWSIVPGIEADAVALFREASTSTPLMPVRTLAKRVATLDAKAKGLRAAELAAKAQDPKAGKATKDAAARAQQQADKAAEKVAKQDAPKPTPAVTPAAATAVDTRPAAPAPEQCRAPVAALGDMAKQGTAKDVAAMMAELSDGADEPDDVLQHYLRAVLQSQAHSKVAKRAVQAALVVLERGDRPAVSPVAVAQALQGSPTGNGTPAAAVA